MNKVKEFLEAIIDDKNFKGQYSLLVKYDELARERNKKGFAAELLCFFDECEKSEGIELIEEGDDNV